MKPVNSKLPIRILKYSVFILILSSMLGIKGICNGGGQPQEPTGDSISCETDAMNGYEAGGFEEIKKEFKDGYVRGYINYVRVFSKIPDSLKMPATSETLLACEPFDSISDTLYQYLKLHRNKLIYGKKLYICGVRFIKLRKIANSCTTYKLILGANYSRDGENNESMSTVAVDRIIYICDSTGLYHKCGLIINDVSMHEFGHAFELTDCANKQCTMHDTLSIDRINCDFCLDCNKKFVATDP